jgi:ADP-ribose pyrophosphatase
MNKKAKRVFKGVIFEVYQWRQKMFDGSYATFEMIKRPPTVEVIGITADKKILILEQRQPNTPVFYSFPGGRVDEGETIRQGALRELREETGHTSQNLKKWKTFNEYTTMDWQINMFIARDCHKVGELMLDPGEKIKVKKITFDQLLKLAEDDYFWCSRYFTKFLFKAKFNQSFKNKLRGELFG